MTATSVARACRLVSAGESFEGKQGLAYTPGISAGSAGAQAIHLQTVTIPPGKKAKAHKHASHETAIYRLKGISEMWDGQRLEHPMVVHPGDYLYIPADMPQQPFNPSSTQSCVALIARADPNEQESVVLLPHLDGLH